MSANDPCECGQTTIRGCADMPSRHCGAWEQTTPPEFTAHELSALAEQGMTLTEAEEATVREARGQTVQPVTDIDKLIAEMRAGLEGVTPGEWSALSWEEDAGGKDWNLWGSKRSNYDYESDLRGDFGNPRDAVHIARCKPTNITALLDEIERLRADNARLLDAIAPLAEKFLWPDDGYDPDNVRADPDWDEQANEGTADDVWITRGAIRRARKAMEASNGK